MKNIIDDTILKIEASLAAVVVRIDALDEQVKEFRDHGRDHDGLVSAIKALSGRVDDVERWSREWRCFSKFGFSAIT